jgi:GntR family transcriptional repressor for pyruvate dehydrogenase complex
MASTFTQVARRSLADEVRQRLQASIASGALAPGARLPSEDVLSSEFGVSRTSVREAIRELIVLGLVERRGNRPHVVEHLPHVRVDASTVAATERIRRLRDVFETRRAIEAPLAAHAAARATPVQRDEISRIAAAFHTATTYDELRALDRGFHLTISAAAGNPLLAELHIKVLDALFHDPRFDSLLTDGEAPDDLTDVTGIIRANALAHAAIAAAIASGDESAASRAAEAHLAEVESRLISRAG